VTTPSSAQALGLSFNAWKPTITPGTSYTLRGAYIPDAFGIVNNYSHELQAVGGYWSAQMQMNASFSQVEDWLFNGLNRHIEVADHALDVIFEEFVNQVSATIGGVTISRGPVMEVSNDVALTYSTVDTSVDPPAVGMRVPTDWAEDSDSQSKYGTLETMLSSGGVTDTEAEQLRDTFLADGVMPRHNQSLTFPPSGESSVSIEVLGYVHRLKKYVYNQTTTGGDTNLSTKLAAVLAAHPDSLYGTGSIETNTVQVKRWENDNNDAWGIIKTLTEIGDASDNRYTFGIYADATPRYEQVPTTTEYSHGALDPEQGIMSRYGGVLKPWNILPGKWLEFTDFVSMASSPSATLRSNPRMMFIESVIYRTPWNLTLRGGRVDTITQQMARLGLAGIGAG